MKNSVTNFVGLALIFQLLFLGCASKIEKSLPSAQEFTQEAEAEWIALNPRFEAAFEYLRNIELDTLSLGVYPIDSMNVYLIVMEGDLKTIENAQLEVHDLYYDLQIAINGVEKFGLRAREECKDPITDMDREKDIQFFYDSYEVIEKLTPKQFIVLSPEVAHAPMIGEGRIKKGVVKIKKQ
ncbi:MAG: YhcH/YjgK/YiaL family protein [Bacteroidales bacterium]